MFSNIRRQNLYVFIHILEYTKDIFELLQNNPQGMSAKEIARYVYNVHNTLFHPVSFDEVCHSVIAYLANSSRRKNSPIEKTFRGVYCLSEQYLREQSMMLDFTDESQMHDASPVSTDVVPSKGLFDDFFEIPSV